MKLRYRPGGGLCPRTPCGGRLIVFKWPERSHRQNSLRRHCKFLSQRKEFTETFSAFIGLIKFESFQIIIRKKFINSCQICSIFRIFFFEKIDFLAKNNVDIFENSIHFLILCIVWKNETSLPSGGPLPPGPPAGRVIAFKWPGRSPPKKTLATPLNYIQWLENKKI